MKWMTALLVSAVLTGCAPHVHTVGRTSLKPPQKHYTVTERQFYVLDWQPLNKVDTATMAGGSRNYTIKTERNLIDLVISGVTVGIITSRTVTVTVTPARYSHRTPKKTPSFARTSGTEP